MFTTLSPRSRTCGRCFQAVGAGVSDVAGALDRRNVLEAYAAQVSYERLLQLAGVAYLMVIAQASGSAAGVARPSPAHVSPGSSQ